MEHLEDYLSRGEYDRALRALDEALDRSPEDPKLLRQQGDVFALVGDRERAVEIYRGLARYYVTDGRHARAIVFYKLILQLAPDRPRLHGELAELITGEASNIHPKPSPVPQETAPASADSESAAGNRVGENHRGEEAPVGPRGETSEVASSALFTLFDTEVLEEVLTLTCLRVFQDGEVILREGDRSSGLFLVVHGRVSVTTGGLEGEPVLLDQLEAGAFFGEMGAIFRQPRTATVTALGTVTTIELTQPALEQISNDHPEVRKTLEDFCSQRTKHIVRALNDHLQQQD